MISISSAGKSKHVKVGTNHERIDDKTVQFLHNAFVSTNWVSEIWATKLTGSSESVKRLLHSQDFWISYKFVIHFAFLRFDMS